MAADHITSILSDDYAHFEEHCMSHPSEAEPVFDCVMELRTVLTAFRMATEASKRESESVVLRAASPAVLPGEGLLDALLEPQSNGPAGEALSTGSDALSIGPLGTEPLSTVEPVSNKPSAEANANPE